MSCWETPLLRLWKFPVEACVGVPHAGGIGNRSERSTLSTGSVPPISGLRCPQIPPRVQLLLWGVGRCFHVHEWGAVFSFRTK